MTTPTTTKAPEQIELGTQRRDSPGVQIAMSRRVSGKKDDEGVMVLSFPASSEAPIERWWGTEILSHEAGALRMDRMTGGAAPLLFNHNWDDPIGMIDGARIEDRRLWVDAHLFDTARAREVASMIDGGLRNVSIGYELFKIEEDTKADTFTARDWGVLEVSIVSVPADPSVGVGRSAEQQPRPVAVLRRQQPPVSSTAAVPAAPKEKATMAETAAAAGANADPEARITPLQAERERKEAIQALCKANKIDARVEARWVEEGAPLTQVSKEILDVIEERGKHKPAQASALGLSRGETERYSMFRAIRLLRHPADPEVRAAAAFEVECSKAVAKQLNRGDSSSLFVPGDVLMRPLAPEAMQRAMSTTPGSKGGYMVNVENMGFIDILRNRSVAMNMGARVLSGLVGNITIPRQTGKASVTWQGGEGVSVNATDQALGQLSMTPRTAIAITDVSEQLLRQATPSAEAFVMADLARDIAIDGVDAAVIGGAGGAQPLGIKNTTGVTTGQDAASATYAKVLAFVSTAAGSNAILENPGWVTNAAGAVVLMQKSRFANTDTPLWEGNVMDGTCVGFRAMSSEQLASSNLIFGSWGTVVIGEWGVLELATDTGGTRFNQAQVGIRAMWMVDVLLRYPQAFVVSTNLSA